MPDTIEVIQDRDQLTAAYIAAGLALVPIKQGEKRTTVKGWNLPENAVYTLDDAAKRLTGNIGLAHAYSSPPTCALDLDNLTLARPWLKQHGIDIDALLAAPDAVRIDSGREGRAKLLYRLPEPLATQEPTDSGLELRCAAANGNTVQDVLPPSIHPDTGLSYRLTGDPAKIPPIPNALLALWKSLEGAKPRGKRLELVKTADPILGTLNVLGMVRADKGHGAYHIECPFEDQHTDFTGDGECIYYLPHTNGFAMAHFKCMHAHCAKRTDNEFRTELTTRLLKQTGRRSAVPLRAVEVAPATSAPAYPDPFPGPMAEAVAACLEVARKPQPILALGAVLSAMAATCGSFFKHADGGRLNLYAIEVARTGAGKDAALRCAKHIGRKSKAKIVGKPASGAGLEDSLTSNLATYCVVDEIAHFFSLMNGSNAKGYELDNASKILELWSAGRDVHTTRERAGKPSVTFDHPAFNLLGVTTPEKLGKAFTPDDFADGLAGRIYFFITDEDPKARRVRKPMNLPASFERVLMEVHRGAHFVLITGGTEIGLTDEADALIDVLLEEFDVQSRDSDSPYTRALCSRSMEKLERAAGVLAVWDNPAAPVITPAHLQWAAQLTRASNAAVLGFVNEYIHGGVEQDNAARLLRMIRDGTTKPKSTSEAAASKAGWVPRSALLRRSKMSVDKEFNPAIRLLVGCGEVVEGEVGGLLVLGLAGDE